jgi:hypothetical protein
VDIAVAEAVVGVDIAVAEAVAEDTAAAEDTVAVEHTLAEDTAVDIGVERRVEGTVVLGTVGSQWAYRRRRVRRW